MLRHRHFRPFTLLPEDRACFTVVTIGYEIMDPAVIGWRRERWHCWQLMYTIAGGGVGDIAGTPMRCAANSVWFMPKDRPYGYQVDPAHGTWEYQWIEFDGAMVASLMRMLGLAERSHVPGCGAAEPLIRQLVTMFAERGDAALHEAGGVLMQIMAVIEACARRGDEGRSPAARIDALVKRALADRLGEDVDLAGVAELAGVSPHHLVRVFTKLNGTSPMSYLAHLRANRAKILLQRPELNITEIGRAVGYPRVPHFSRMFSRETGMSPRAFRRAMGVADG
ncbi:MAG: AraC family transcriptional regulator [Planctomycetes bacterium]|nr:AraC family transcriptional regulator [Planctomycetota bacterium]